MSEKDLQTEFLAHVYAVTHTSVDYLLNERLGNLREFFFAHPAVFARPDVRAFFDRWIEPNEIAIYHGAAGNWDEVSMLEMFGELEALKVGD